ncbi:MAG: hypothetical protein ACKPCN_12375, partial [Dolichospermum sp.]
MQQRFAIAHPQLPNSDRIPFNLTKSDRIPELPKQRTACSSASLSHPLNFLTAIAPLQLPNSELTSQ